MVDCKSQTPASKTIHVNGIGEDFTLHGSPCSLSYFSHVEPKRLLPPNRTYYNTNKEDARTVPVITSSVHGHYIKHDIDPPDRLHTRSFVIEHEFYRPSGVKIE